MFMDITGIDLFDQNVVWHVSRLVSDVLGYHWY